MAWFYFYKKDKGQYVATEGIVTKRFKHERGKKDSDDKYYLEFHTPFGFVSDLASEEGIVFFNSLWLEKRDDTKAIDILLAHRQNLLSSCERVIRMYPERKAVVLDTIKEHESAIESLKYKGILTMRRL